MPQGQEALEKEVTRWREREHRLLETLEEVDEERRRLLEELAKVEEQVAYYESLTREMKRELGRTGLSDLMSSLRKT